MILLRNILLILFLSSFSLMAGAQLFGKMQFDRDPGYRGIGVFETSKADTVAYEGMKVNVGGDFALIFQGISQSNDLVGDTLVDLATNFNLPAANLNINVQLADGLRMHLRTYLSSRNHNEAWVKGGYMQMDKLDFIREDFLEDFMQIATIRIGFYDINYGDTHFRRSDNARSIYNPFVGNYIMDAFTTEPFAELTLQKNGLLGVAGITNGRLNQSPAKGDDGVALYAKVGFDRYFDPDLRFRITGSVYTSTSNNTRDYLYNGDRAGARYYDVLHGINDNNPSNFLPRFNPRFPYQTAFQINPYLTYRGLEFFGVIERTSNGNDEVEGDFTQLGAELLYRLGSREQFYIGTRYNQVSGETSGASETQKITRFNLGGGWFLTNNVLTKLEYVTSSYSGDGYDGTKFQGAEFDGVVFEAVISF